MKLKKSVTIVAAVAVVVSCLTLLFGCVGVAEEEKPVDAAKEEYTIQYTDDSGTHQITVAAGMPYALDVIPAKNGFTFTGLYDAEVGGTQYVSASGASLSPFTDGKNLVLFPQFRAKDFTVILDYQGAPVTGSRQFTVPFGSSLPELPKNLTSEHKEFTGWYTKTDGEGLRVADQYGLIPVVSVLNDTNFDLSGAYVYLYAGFEIETFTVTCCFEAGMDTENVQVPYDTPVGKIVTRTRVDGKAPLTWSKTQGGEVFNGRVIDDTVLYAVEYAPVIDLDCDGGSGAAPIVARAGATIALPTPVKELAKFAYWEDMQGNRYDSATMPDKSISLKAVWQAKLVFDSNGGSEVKDISAAAGDLITLPTPDREGFIFAGWYTAEKDAYTSLVMPAAGVKLKAGWYKTKTSKKDFLSGDSTSSVIGTKTPRLYSSYNIDFTEEFSEIDWNNTVNVKIIFHADIRHWYNHYSLSLYATKEHFYYYSQAIVNDAYLVSHIIVDHGNGSINGNYVKMTFSANMSVTGGKIYAALAADKDNFYATSYSTYYSGWDMKNFWAEIEYPDTTNLYL